MVGSRNCAKAPQEIMLQLRCPNYYERVLEIERVRYRLSLPLLVFLSSTIVRYLELFNTELVHIQETRYKFKNF